MRAKIEGYWTLRGGASWRSCRTTPGSTTKVGRRVNLSAPAAAERMRRMEEAGIITGYRAQVDPEKVGLPLAAFVRIEVPGANHKKVEALVVELPEVLECHRATGTDCYVMKVVLASMDHLQTLLDKLVMWGSPVTSIVISSPVPGRGIQRQPIPPRMAVRPLAGTLDSSTRCGPQHSSSGPFRCPGDSPLPPAGGGARPNRVLPRVRSLRVARAGFARGDCGGSFHPVVRRSFWDGGGPGRNLVRIDVADPGENLLIHQRRLDLTPPPFEPLTEGGEVQV